MAGISPREGEGMATVIPFPSRRVSIPTEGDQKSWPGKVIDYNALKESLGERPAPETGGSVPRGRESERAHRVALRHLSVTGRSEAEVRDALAARELAPGVIDEEISRLVSAGLIDDRALALHIIERGQRVKKLGSAALRHQLRLRQIPAALADEVLAGVVPDEDALIQLATTRMASMAHLPEEVARRRLSSFLQRRGYSSSEVARAVASAMAAGPADQPAQSPRSR